MTTLRKDSRASLQRSESQAYSRMYVLPIKYLKTRCSRAITYHCEVLNIYSTK